ncbi:thiol-disulfide oxidoreductase [Litorivita pollutaquae]|uniref:Thiol-disulfide oxidoreductase n=1 Tax=Litorivita pollutaquae TaxID=2200892 RepID=A0A2V4ND25_9RHOB|nr:DsbA family protein [Litorivita pollutaquae]PYC47660.1 thiol-disulfide oxidoreductase [Litorivita pollutaquae]
MNRRTMMVGAASAAIVAGLGGWIGFAGRGAGTPPNPLGAANAADDTAEIDTSGIKEMTLGDPNAPITVIEYASFTCPHCASFHEDVLKPFKAEYVDTGKVYFIYRDVYFDRFGLWASMLARCGDGMRFFGVADLLYAQQKQWLGGGDPVSIANALRKIGAIAGLDEDTVTQCLEDGDKAQALVAWYQKNGTADDITGTPTLIIDGEKQANMSYGELKTLIDSKLSD